MQNNLKKKIKKNKKKKKKWKNSEKIYKIKLNKKKKLFKRIIKKLLTYNPKCLT